MISEKRLNALRHLPGYLHEIEDGDRLRALLSSFSFLERKVRNLNASELVSDYEYLPEDSPLRLVQAAVRLSAYILDRDPGQLAGHLLGRLLDHDATEITDLLDTIREQHPLGLFPTVASMTRPGGALLQTFSALPSIGTIYAIVPTLDGERVVSASSDRTIRIWSLASGQALRILRGHEREVTALKLISDGRLAVSGSRDRTVRIWDLETGIQKIKMPTARGVEAIAVTPNGQQAIAGLDDGSIEVLSISTEDVQHLFGHEKQILCLAITPDEQRLISGSEDGTLRVWNLSSGALERVESFGMKVWSVIATPESSRLIFSLQDGTIAIHNLIDGRSIDRFKGHRFPATFLTLARDGRTLISASSGKIVICDLENVHTQTTMATPGNLSAMALTLDENRALISSYSGRITLWDLSALRPTEEQAEEHSIGSLALIPGSALLLSASGRTVKIWDAEKGQEIRTLTGHTDRVASLAVLPNGAYAVSGSLDKTIKVWDLRTGENLRTLQGHESAIIALAVTEDGKRVISGGLHAEVKVWSLEDGRELYSRRRPRGYLTTLAATSDGRLAVVGLRMRGMHGRRFSTLRQVVSSESCAGMRIQWRQRFSSRVTTAF
ncbi:MAG: WD40 repeat domain-containing protein [Acidobacteriota bacterium]